MCTANETAIELVNIPQRIIPTKRSILSVSTEQLARLKTLADMMHGSILSYSKDGNTQLSHSDIFIIMLKGLEVGLEPIASMDLIDVIKGKPSLKPQGMLSLIWGSGLLETLNITDDGNTCKVMIKRQGVSVHTETFSAEDAQKMGLAGRDSWKKQPATMRKWRAISAACRIVFPDVIQGMYIPEEIGPELPVSDQGEIVTDLLDSGDDVVKEQSEPVTSTTPEIVSEESPDEITGDGPEVYALNCTHMVYEVAGRHCVKFANSNPTDGNGSIILTAYRRSTTFKKIIGDFAYDLLDLKQYTGVKKTTKWIEIPIAGGIEFEYIEENIQKGKNKGSMYRKIVGVVGADNVLPHELDSIPF